jgi:hypothetical protein
MRTVIFVGNDNTTLTIDTHEDAYLEQMGQGDTPVRLKAGHNKVTVARGVFKVLSNKLVQVTSTGDHAAVVTPEKTDDPLHPTRPLAIRFEFDPDTVRSFTEDSRGSALPDIGV